jgi:hypothetical protein
MLIPFEYNTEYGLFSDSLWFPDDEPLPSDAEIEAMELERLNNWLAIVTPQPDPEPSPGPTEEQLV